VTFEVLTEVKMTKLLFHFGFDSTPHSGTTQKNSNFSGISVSSETSFVRGKKGLSQYEVFFAAAILYIVRELKVGRILL
jgi:hypothetical protein